MVGRSVDKKDEIRAYIKVPGRFAQAPPHSLVQMQLVFWMTNKLSLMKLSTDNHKWNVIRCLMSSQRFRNRNSKKTPVIWQGFGSRCNTCRDLQSGRSSSYRGSDGIISHYVKKSRHLSRIQGCNNYPPIQTERESSSLSIIILSIAGKILARIRLDRLNEHLEQWGLLPESQCGVRKDWRTIDMIFTARQLQEKCQEQNVDLYMTFVDLTYAFDTVSREGLWKIMAKFCCPAKFIAIVRPFHDGMLARVQHDGEFSDPFPVTNGVKQGCVLSSLLFSMIFSAMLIDAFLDAIPIMYRFDLPFN